MNAVLLIEMFLLAISAVIRALVITINPARTKKLTGVLSSFSIFLPAIALWFGNRGYYFSDQTPNEVKLTVVILLFSLFILICFSLYKEYVEYKKFKTLNKI